MSGSVFRREVEVFLSRGMSPEARSQHLASVARAGLKEILDGRSTKTYRKFVDGVEDAPEDKVRPEGVIRYQFSLLPLVIGFLLGYLKERSPVRSGRFKRNFWISVNGRMIPELAINPDKIPMDAEIYIGNFMPYNRRVDVQLDGRRPLRFSTPPNLYREAAAAASRRFGAVLSIYRIYTVEFPGQYVLKTGPRRGKRVHSPAIHITSRA